MRLYDWKSNDTRDIVVSYDKWVLSSGGFEKGWLFDAETKSATSYLNKLGGPQYKYVKTLEDGVLYTDDPGTCSMLLKILKSTNFVVDLHLGESK